MISFLNMAFLLGLPLAGAPVVIHLLNRRRRRVIEWGAMQFLVEAATTQRRLAHLDDWLLMLLRALAILLIVLALAQPRLRGGGGGGRGVQDVVVMMDTSMSTAARATGGGPRLFDRQAEAATAFVESLRDGDMVRLMEAGSPPQWRTTAAVAMNKVSRAELSGAIRALEPTLARADFAEALQAAFDAPPTQEGRAKIIVLFCDGLAFGWRDWAERPWRQIHEQLKNAETATQVQVVAAHHQAAGLANRCVDQVTTTRSVVATGEHVTFRAVVSNHADDSRVASTGVLTWTVGPGTEPNVLGSGTTPAIEAGGTGQASFTHAFTRPGVFEVSASLEAPGPDALALDDQGRLVIEVVESLPVLLVTADGSARDSVDMGESDMLMLALGVHGSGERAAPFTVNVIRLSQLGLQRLEDYRCVVLLNCEAPSAAVATALKTYVEGGGGLWVLPGWHTEVAAFNEVMWAEGAGICPLRLDQVIDMGERPVGLRLPLQVHPATRVLREAEGLDVVSVQLRRRHRFMGTSSRDDVTVLLTTSGGGEPAVIEHTVGRGRVIVQTAAVDLEWSKLALSRAFVVMAHEFVWRLCEPAAGDYNLRPGRPLRVRVPAGDQPGEGRLTLPTGQVVALQPEIDRDNEVYTYGRTDRPGLYQLALGAGSDGPARLPFHVRRAAAESRLTTLTHEQRNDISEWAGLQFVDRPQRRLRGGDAGEAARRPVWGALLAGLLMLLGIELLLAWWLNGRARGEMGRGGVEHGPKLEPEQAA